MKNKNNNELEELMGALMALSLLEELLKGIEEVTNEMEKEEVTEQPKEEEPKVDTPEAKDSVFEVDFGGMKFKGNHEDYKVFISSMAVLQDIAKEDN